MIRLLWVKNEIKLFISSRFIFRPFLFIHSLNFDMSSPGFQLLIKRKAAIPIVKYLFRKASYKSQPGEPSSLLLPLMSSKSSLKYGVIIFQ